MTLDELKAGESAVISENTPTILTSLHPHFSKW